MLRKIAFSLVSLTIVGVVFLPASCARVPIVNGCFIQDFTVCEKWDLRNQKTTLNQAHLSEATLNGSLFDDSVLRTADLSLAKLNGASMKRVVMQAAKLDDAELGVGPRKDLTTVNNPVDLTDGDLRQVTCPNANFTEAKMDGINFTSASCRNANFTKTSILLGTGSRRPTFASADFEIAKLSASTITGPVFDNSIFKDADFSRSAVTAATGIGVDMSGARFHGATFKTAAAGIGGNFNDIKAVKVDFSANRFLDSSFQNADLRCANLNTVNFNGMDSVDFSNTDLRGATLNGVTGITAVDLDNAITCRTMFNGTEISKNDPACADTTLAEIQAECNAVVCGSRTTQTDCTVSGSGCQWTGGVCTATGAPVALH